MSWEWSHSPEAYSDAYARVQLLPTRTLLTILREWACDDREKANRPPSFRLPRGLRQLPRDMLADLVWARAEEYRTCSNGGWDCYLCPDGCHTVPFAPLDDESSSRHVLS